MATGQPDYRRGVDIEAQSITTLAIDIAAQTLAKLDVDIIAQSLGNLNVDIVAQALAKLDVDIIAQTVGNLAIDIASQSLATMNVDLVAQTLAQLNIDIIAQTIGNLTIDIVAQNLSEIMNRPKYGAAQSVAFAGAVTANDLTPMIEILGKGMTYGGCIMLTHTATQKGSFIVVKIDGFIMGQLSFETMNTYGLDRQYVFPYFVLVYDDTNFVYSLGLPNGYTFETSFEVLYREANGETPNVNCIVDYALV